MKILTAEHYNDLYIFISHIHKCELKDQAEAILKGIRDRFDQRIAYERIYQLLAPVFPISKTSEVFGGRYTKEYCQELGDYIYDRIDIRGEILPISLIYCDQLEDELRGWEISIDGYNWEFSFCSVDDKKWDEYPPAIEYLITEILKRN